MPQIDPQDILIVKNIDDGSGEPVIDVQKVLRRQADDEGRVTTFYEDVADEFNPADFFQVKWGGQPFRIAPGQTRRMPRYIAEHFAKHLADYVLNRREVPVNHKTERPKVLNEILVDVEEYYLGDAEIDPGQQAAEQVDALNATDLGSVPNKAEGVLVEPPSSDEILANTTPEDEQSPGKSEQGKDLPSRKELLQECIKLGIEITGKESYDQLKTKISKF